MAEALMRRTEPCLICGHLADGMTQRALDASIKAHVEYVNTVMDKTSDPHFEDARLNRLIEH